MQLWCLFIEDLSFLFCTAGYTVILEVHRRVRHCEHTVVSVGGGRRWLRAFIKFFLKHCCINVDMNSGTSFLPTNQKFCHKDNLSLKE